MNIMSYNVRGLGRGVKWVAIRRMVKNKKVTKQSDENNNVIRENNYSLKILIGNDHWPP